MATVTQQTIIEADASKAVKSISDLKSEVKQLKKELDDCAVGSIEAASKSQALSQAQTELTAAMKGAVTETNELDGSYNGLVAQMASLKAMQKQVDVSTAEGRKRYSEYATAINEINNNLKGLDAENGVFGRNVGNYVGALQQLPGILGQVGGGLSSIGAQAKTLMANPWVAVIGLIIGAISKLVDQFKKSEERMNSLKMATSSFKPILDAVNKGFSTIANLLSSGLSKALDWATNKLGKFMGALDKLGKWLGKDWNLSGSWDEAVEKARELTASEQAYVEHKRQYTKDAAKLENEIADLRDKVANKDMYNSRERLAMLDQAIQKEVDLASKKKKLAEENLAIIKAEAARDDNDAAANDKLAEAESEVTRVESELYDTRRRLQSQRQTLIQEIDNERESVDKLSVSIAAIPVNASDALAKTLPAVKESIDEIVEYTEEWTEVGTKAFENMWKVAGDKKKAKIAMTAFTSVGNSVSDMLSGIADNFDENSKQYKGLMITSTIISMMTGIAQAVSQAMELGPIAGPIVGAINAATVTATGIASIAKIKSANENSSVGSSTSSAGTSSAVTQNIVAPVEYAQATGASADVSQSDTRVYVTETDISSTQNKVRVVESEARF